MNNSRSFTSKIGGLARELKTPCHICEAFEPSSGKKHPPFTQVVGLWDTGASCSAISRRLVEAIGLQPSGFAQINHANGTSQVPTYLINILLPNNVGIPTLVVTEANLNGDFDILIGMDVISKGDFSISNFNGKTIFSFRIPSIQDTDFVEDSKTQPPATLSMNLPTNKPIIKEKKPGRNEPCHCGSGKKYKHCHGINDK